MMNNCQRIYSILYFFFYLGCLFYSFCCELVHDLSPLDDTCIYIKVRRIEEGICGAEKYTQDRLLISSLLVELHTHTPRASDSVIQRGTGGGKVNE